MNSELTEEMTPRAGGLCSAQWRKVKGWFVSHKSMVETHPSQFHSSSEWTVSTTHQRWRWRDSLQVIRHLHDNRGHSWLYSRCSAMRCFHESFYMGLRELKRHCYSNWRRKKHRPRELCGLSASTWSIVSKVVMEDKANTIAQVSKKSTASVPQGCLAHYLFSTRGMTNH